MGGLTGVLAGAALDRGSKKALTVGEQVREHVPEAGRWLQSATDKAVEWVQETDVPRHVRSAAHRVAESDAAKQVRQSGDEVIAAATGVSKSYFDL